MKWLIDLIVTLLTGKKYKFGKEVFREEAGWKLTGMAKTEYGLFIGTCKADRNPQRSRWYLDFKRVYEGGDETITQPCVHGANVFAVGECGNLLRWTGDGVQKMRNVRWATHVGKLNGQPVVFDYNGQVIKIFNCLDSIMVGVLPGKGVVTASVEYGDHVIAAVCDSEGGFAGTDERIIKAHDTLCLVEYNGNLYGSRGNEVVRVEWDKQRLMGIETLPGKITDMQVADGKLFIACAGPDQLWVMDRLEDCSRISALGGKPIGGSVFHSRVTDGYYGRSENNETAVVYEVE